MDERQITNPHANLFHKVFSSNDIARDFIRHYLPESVVEKLDLNTLTLDRESFVDICLSSTQSDLIFKVKQKNGEEILIYILFEHKSFLDRWVLFQLLGYIIRLGEREREVNAIERKNRRKENIENGLPENTGIEKECVSVVLPVIMYHGKKDWNVDKKLSALYCGPGSFFNYIPEFDYELVDLNALKNHQVIGNVYLRVTILVMKHYHSNQFDDIFEEALILLANYIDDWSTIHFVAVITLYSGSHKSRGQQWIQSTIQKKYPKIFGEKGGDVMFGVSNIWIEQGIKEGMEKGMEKGMKKMLLDAISIKYQNISQSIATFIQSIKDEEILHRLHREVFSCNNISEFQHRIETIRAS